jgi:hypothetical protein
MSDRTVRAVKDRNQDIDAESLQSEIDEAVREVRLEIRKLGR